MRRKRQNALSVREQERKRKRNQQLSRRRSRIERTFGTMKRTYGFSRARYKGLVKVHGEAVLKAMCYNLVRAVNILAEA